MINKIYQNFLEIITKIIDSSNKKKIINYFKSKIGRNKIILFDVGAHKGETIDLFLKLNISKIYAFEPNKKLFKYLEKKKNKFNNIKVFDFALGIKNEEKYLNILKDTSSSTFNNLNIKSKYFKRKNKYINFFSKKDNLISNTQKTNVVKTSDFFEKHKIDKVDIFKMDTEGYEYNVLCGLEENDFKKIDFIYFEHHYDLMIKKGYKFKDISEILMKNNFQPSFKVKMKFRKSFEYIYEKKK